MENYRKTYSHRVEFPDGSFEIVETDAYEQQQARAMLQEKINYDGSGGQIVKLVGIFDHTPQVPLVEQGFSGYAELIR